MSVKVVQVQSVLPPLAAANWYALLNFLYETKRCKYDPTYERNHRNYN
mgnify:CR=1|jgi:hypothetical protein